MSGGSLDCAYGKINYVKDDIKSLLEMDFKNEHNIYKLDYLNECTPEQRKQFIKSMKKLSKKLDSMSKELHALEWFFSGDYGYDTYMEEMNKIRKVK